MPYSTNKNLNKSIFNNMAPKILYSSFISVLISPFYLFWKIFYSTSKKIYTDGLLYTCCIVAVFILFLAVRFSMFRYTGNYPDEYSHILSGIHLFKHGTLPKLVRYTETWQYTRGMHISFLVGVFTSLFGKTLTVAKLVPIFLGSLNFLMMANISKKTIYRKEIRIVFLLIFAFFALIIFNHFYIRGYIFLEFSLILLVYLAIHLSYFIKNNNYTKSTAIFLLMLIVSFIYYAYTNDRSEIIIPLALILTLLSIYITYFPSKIHNIRRFIGKVHSSTLTYIIIFIIAVLAIAYFASSYPRFLAKLSFLLHGTTNTESAHIDFYHFFADINLLFSLFLILSVGISLLKKDRPKLLLLGIITPLLALHGISSEDLQIMRGMLYILPLYLICALFTLDYLVHITKKKRLLFLTIALLLFMPTLSNNYNKVFSRGYPRIPSEIGYHEYSKQYEFLNNNLHNYVVFNAQYSSQKSLFYAFDYDYKLNFNNKLSNHYRHYSTNNNIEQLYTDTPLITEFNHLKNIVRSAPKACVVLKPFSKSAFLGESAYEFITRNMILVSKGIGYKIYCNKYPK